MPKEITAEQIAAYRNAFAADPQARVAQNAVCGQDIQSLSLSRSQVQAIDDSFSIRLDEWSVTHQKQSGRCWLFAAPVLVCCRCRCLCWLCAACLQALSESPARVIALKVCLRKARGVGNRSDESVGDGLHRHNR